MMRALTDRRIDDATDAGALVRLLFDTGESMPGRLRERILGSGQAVVAPLIALLLEDEQFGFEEGPGEGWAPIHAATLLGELKEREALRPLARQLAATEPGTYLHDGLKTALMEFGAEAVEPTLNVLAEMTDVDSRVGLWELLTRLGVRDERIFEALVNALEEDLGDGIVAMYLADYGDPRALPYLSAALDQCEYVENNELLANHAVIELQDAIERLGGELTPEQQEKLRQIRSRDVARLDRLWPLLNQAIHRMDLPASPVRGASTLATAPRPAPAPRKVGRNDPCPCGSGRKYKKCCLGKADG